MEGFSDDVLAGLAFLDQLPRNELSAFLGLFAGARFPWISFNGETPHMGKTECEVVGDWRDFYLVRLRDAGLFYANLGTPRPALGMAPGSTSVTITCNPTPLAWQVRDAWWVRLALGPGAPSSRPQRPPALSQLAWAYVYGYVLFGVYLFDLWGLPRLAHRSAMDALAMEECA